MLGLTAQAWYDILYMILLIVAFLFTHGVFDHWRTNNEVPNSSLILAAIAWAALIVFFFN